MWITIVMGLISAIPDIIKVIQDIIALLQSSSTPAIHQMALENHLLTWHLRRDPVELKAKLEQLKSDLMQSAPSARAPLESGTTWTVLRV